MHIVVIGGAFISMMLLLLFMEKMMELGSFLRSVWIRIKERKRYMRPQTRYFTGG